MRGFNHACRVVGRNWVMLALCFVAVSCVVGAEIPQHTRNVAAVSPTVGGSVMLAVGETPQSGDLRARDTNTPVAVSLTGTDPTQHIVKTGDVLEVKVFQEDDLSARSRVAQDGTVTLPLLGQVKVAGMTLAGATRQVHKLLGNDYLVNPVVIVTLVETVKSRFTILGQVQAPGMYELPEGEELSLLQAISLAGGYTRLANPARITLRRREGAGEILTQFDGKALAKGRNTKRERIQAGDTIYVPERVF